MYSSDRNIPIYMLIRIFWINQSRTLPVVEASHVHSRRVVVLFFQQKLQSHPRK